MLGVIVGVVVTLRGGSPAKPTASTPTTTPIVKVHTVASSGRSSGASSPLSPTWKGDGRAVTFGFGGDVHFEGSLGTRLAADPATALDGNIADLLAGVDLSMTNFESALTTGGCPTPQPKQYVFHAPASAITAFQSARVTLVTEANNHGEDCGAAGLQMSLSLAQAAHYPVIGIGQNAAHAFAPYRTTIKGQRIAIIAATEVIDTDLQTAWTATATQPGLASAYDESQLVAAVEAARKTADTVIVFLHWGTETQTCPNAIQEPLAAAVVKAGADIVIGSHAHVQLGAGYLGSALVDYGLGNLAFYDTTPPETYSGTLIVTATGRHIDSYRWRPAVIDDGLPTPLAGPPATSMIQRWQGLISCTDLSATPGASTATAATETRPLHVRPITPLADPKGGSPGTTRRAAKASQDS